MSHPNYFYFITTIQQLSEQANIDKAYIVIAAAAIPIMLIFALGNGHFLIDLVG